MKIWRAHHTTQTLDGGAALKRNNTQHGHTHRHTHNLCRWLHDPECLQWLENSSAWSLSTHLIESLCQADCVCVGNLLLLQKKKKLIHRGASTGCCCLPDYTLSGCGLPPEREKKRKIPSSFVVVPWDGFLLGSYILWRWHTTTYSFKCRVSFLRVITRPIRKNKTTKKLDRKNSCLTFIFLGGGDVSLSTSYSNNNSKLFYFVQRYYRHSFYYPNESKVSFFFLLLYKMFEEFSKV